jgi:thiamine biosynthesis lipoprotein
MKPTPASTAAALRRVEQHMSTAVTLGAVGVDDTTADEFFERIRRLEGLLTRFRPDSDISRLAAGELDCDSVDPAVRGVLNRCEELRRLTRGDFEHEPRRRTGRAADPVLDVNALAKGWIIEEAAIVLRLSGGEFFVNAGGDVLASRRRHADRPWRIGVQHPDDRTAVLGVFELEQGAVATSGAYERGRHIRSAMASPLRSVSVVGPDLGEADALSTAVYASGESPPDWWADVDPGYGLLTLDENSRLRWIPPRVPTTVVWRWPEGDAGPRPGG